MDRLNDARMDYYKSVYKQSAKWDGATSLADKHVIVYAEQGFGDIIQFGRYLPALIEKAQKVTFHCPKELHRLFADLSIELLDKNNPHLPKHDSHVLSLELPFLLQDYWSKSEYLTINEKADLSEFDEFVKIGIAWEGNPSHPNKLRNCPLKYFKCLEQPHTRLFMLQKEMHDLSLLADCEQMDLNGYPIEDFLDTAKLINALDVIVTVDTSVLHLAGSMGKKAFALLSCDCDPRWDMSHWYDSVVFIKQKQPNDWAVAFNTLLSFVSNFN